ncbi:MAG: DUF883 family protein [Candidatus Thermochlorobacter aerophilum]|jgi:ElaB/YqjD/DUF883 family membrane-anchored ribosome-binding protein|uniref:DUF883 family protein n=1 Tax=Candidatus Thermochlorobacter aerophilus TaxID=1868324 RepID=A0A395M3F6_9BACT|nr:MAG: DUF883 family protein [Candidatus Thermochlorobacter aerophilum]
MSDKTFKNTAEEATETAHTTLSDRFAEYYEKLAETSQFQNVKEAADSVLKYIERHPVQSALIALGVGFLLGLLVNRRND